MASLLESKTVAGANVSGNCQRRASIHGNAVGSLPAELSGDVEAHERVLARHEDVVTVDEELGSSGPLRQFELADDAAGEVLEADDRVRTRDVDTFTEKLDGEGCVWARRVRRREVVGPRDRSVLTAVSENTTPRGDDDERASQRASEAVHYR
jgi:hypothetical protein